MRYDIIVYCEMCKNIKQHCPECVDLSNYDPLDADDKIFLPLPLRPPQCPTVLLTGNSEFSH
jgi:hypothetical protein